MSRPHIFITVIQTLARTFEMFGKRRRVYDLTVSTYLGFVRKGQQRQAGSRKQKGIYIWFGFSDRRVHLF
jgi:hypothetical protein